MGNQESRVNQSKPLLQDQEKFFSDCNAQICEEFSASYQEGVAHIVKLASEVENFKDVNIYKTVIETVQPQHMVAQRSFSALLMKKSIVESIEGRSAQELRDDEVLQFHNDNLDLVTNEELTYQIKLESAFSDTRRYHEKLLFECGMDAVGKSFVGNNPVRLYLEHLRPGRIALYLQNTFDDLFGSPHIARIAFRFIGWCFYANIQRLYEQWHSTVKIIADRLSLRQTLELMPQSEEKGSKDSEEGEEDTVTMSGAVAKALQDQMSEIHKATNVASAAADAAKAAGIDIEALNDRVSQLLTHIGEIEIPASLGSSGGGPGTEAGGGVAGKAGAPGGDGQSGYSGGVGSGDPSGGFGGGEEISLSTVELNDLGPNTVVETLPTADLVDLLGKLQTEAATPSLGGSSKGGMGAGAGSGSGSGSGSDSSTGGGGGAGSAGVNVEGSTGGGQGGPGEADGMGVGSGGAPGSASGGTGTSGNDSAESGMGISISGAAAGGPGGDNVRGALKSALTGMSDDNIMTVVDRVSENIINLVTHLFETITTHKQLNNEVGFQISRAQLPVMRLALADTALFQTADHPARNYINNLGHLGMRVGDTQEEGYAQIKESVDRLLRDFNGEVEIFDQLNQEIKGYIHESGYQQDEISEEALQDEVAERPSLVNTFLEKQQKGIKREFMFHRFSKLVWEALLSRIHEEAGEQSYQWKSATNTYSEMVWSTQVDAQKPIVQQQVLRRIPKIVISVRKLFAEYNLSDGVREAILNYMFRIHMQIVKGVPLMEIEDDFSQMLCDNKSLPSPAQAPPVDIIDTSRVVEGSAEEVDPDDEALSAPSSTKEDLDRADPSLAYKYAKENTGTIDFGEKVVVDLPEGDEAQEPVRESRFKNTGFEEDPASGSDRAAAQVKSVADAETSSLFTGQEELAGAFDQAKDFRVGDMFELQRDGIKHRYQLTHVSNIFGKYTFREFGTRVLLEVGKPDLVIDILRGSIKKISNTALFDNSLESVISQIRQPGNEETEDEEGEENEVGSA